MFRAPIDPRVLLDGDELRHRAWRAAVRRYHAETGQRIRAELHPTPVGALRPKVLIACRPAMGDQVGDGATAMIKAATAAGWRAGAYYSMTQGVDGGLLEVCVVRFRRGAYLVGRACWERTAGGNWSFESAWLGPYRFGWVRGKDARKSTIREIVAQLSENAKASDL